MKYISVDVTSETQMRWFYLSGVSVPEVEGGHEVRVVLLHTGGPLGQLSGLQAETHEYFTETN